MKNIVNIIGGVGTKIENYKVAIEVYNAYKFKVNFYQFKYLAGIIPKYYMNTVQTATDNTNKEGYNKLILHSNCGGFWPSLFLNNNIKHNLFVLESGPVPTTEEIAVNSLKTFYNITIPNKIARYIGKDIIGINSIENKEWADMYYTALPKLNNLLIMTTEKDTLIKHEYVNEFVNTMKNHTYVHHHKFKTGSHFNLSKHEKEVYQAILEKHIIDKVLQTNK